MAALLHKETEYTLDKWGASSIVANALLVVTELVTNAVKATGVTDEHPNWSELDHLNLIRVRLVGLDASVVITVWDSDPYPPADTDLDDENSRSLQLIESVTSRWDSYPVSQGKVVWAELPSRHPDDQGENQSQRGLSHTSGCPNLPRPPRLHLHRPQNGQNAFLALRDALLGNPWMPPAPTTP
jgi:hypothetical protein